MKPTVAVLALLLPNAALADLTVQLAPVVIPEGTTTTTATVTVIGGDPVSEMNAIVQVAGGGPLVGAPAAPEITAVDYSSSIWTNAPGGFVSFFASSSPSASIIDPSLALRSEFESVPGTGTLMTLDLDTAGFPIGDYPVTLTNTAAGDSELFHARTPVPTTFLPGTVSIVRALDHWRTLHFATAAENPTLEATLWGNEADPDLDGYTNLIEFTIGTDPNAPGHPAATSTSIGLPSSTITGTAPNRSLEITYSRRKTATGLTATISSSEDQTTWQTPAPGLTNIGSPIPIGDGLYEFVRIRLPIDNPAGRLFSRIIASHAP